MQTDRYLIAPANGKANELSQQAGFFGEWDFDLERSIALSDLLEIWNLLESALQFLRPELVNVGVGDHPVILRRNSKVSWADQISGILRQSDSLEFGGLEIAYAVSYRRAMDEALQIELQFATIVLENTGPQTSYVGLTIFHDFFSQAAWANSPDEPISRIGNCIRLKTALQTLEAKLGGRISHFESELDVRIGKYGCQE